MFFGHSRSLSGSKVDVSIMCFWTKSQDMLYICHVMIHNKTIKRAKASEHNQYYCLFSLGVQY